ncbi:MAG: glutaredoxin family protein [Anaerolineae bacterium]
MDKEVVVYARTTGCPYQSIAERVFERYDVPRRMIWIDEDPAAMERVLKWTGYQSVPTIVIAEPGEDLPVSEPDPITGSPRGIDRGAMITEPSRRELTAWLRKHGLIAEEAEAAG